MSAIAWIEAAGGAFNWVLRSSAGAAIIILLVLATQWVMGRRLPPRARQVMWFLAAMRLILPPIAEVALPIPHWAALHHAVVTVQANAIPARSGTVIAADGLSPPVAQVDVKPSSENSAIDAEQNLKTGDEPLVSTELPLSPVQPNDAPQSASDDGAMNQIAIPAPVPPATHLRAPLSPPLVPVARPTAAVTRNFWSQTRQSLRQLPWRRLLMAGWLLGVVLMLARLAWTSWRLSRAVHRLQPVADPLVAELLRDCGRFLGVRRLPIVLQAPAGAGPALVGALRPRLLLPPCVLRQFGCRELRLICLHELVHLKRRDISVGYLLGLLRALHWFNPLVWLAFRQFRAESELACDDAVLRATPWRESRAYGSTIVKLLEMLSQSAHPLSVGAVQHSSLMHRRIAMIARFDGAKSGWSSSGTLLSLLIGGAALVGVVRAEDSTSEPAKKEAPAAIEVAPATPEDGAVDTAREAIEQAAEAPADPGSPAPGAPAEVAPVDVNIPPPGPAVDVAPSPEGSPDSPTPPVAGPGPNAAGDRPVPAPGAIPPESAAPSDLPGAAPAATPPAGSPAVSPNNLRPGLRQPTPSNLARPGMFRPPVYGRGQMPDGVIAAPGADRVETVEDATAVKADAKALQKLQHPYPLAVDNLPLRDVLDKLAQQSGVDILIDNKALSEAGQDLNQSVSLNIREPQPTDQLLRMVLRVVGGDELGYSLVHGVVFVSNKQDLERRLVTRVYNIDDAADQQVRSLAAAITDSVAPQSWQNGGSVLRVYDRKLVVTTSEPTQREVEKLIEMLRQNPSSSRGRGGATPSSGRPFLEGTAPEVNESPNGQRGPVEPGAASPAPDASVPKASVTAPEPPAPAPRSSTSAQEPRASDPRIWSTVEKRTSSQEQTQPPSEQKTATSAEQAPGR